jgi:hypothetical protein
MLMFGYGTERQMHILISDGRFRSEVDLHDHVARPASAV